MITAVTAAKPGKKKLAHGWIKEDQVEELDEIWQPYIQDMLLDVNSSSNKTDTWTPSPDPYKESEKSSTHSYTSLEELTCDTSPVQ